MSIRQHPCANEPKWELRDGEWTRPLLSAEHFLDQVHQLADGHDELAIGFSIFKCNFPVDELKRRLTSALARLRFFSPLVASRCLSGLHDHQLRSWAYKCCPSGTEALAWATKTLQLVSHPGHARSYAHQLVSKRHHDTQPEGLKDQPFACHLVIDSEAADASTAKAIFLHGTHALLDGNGALTVLNRLFSWIVNPPKDEVKWGETSV